MVHDPKTRFYPPPFFPFFFSVTRFYWCVWVGRGSHSRVKNLAREVLEETGRGRARVLPHSKKLELVTARAGRFPHSEPTTRPASSTMSFPAGRAPERKNYFKKTIDADEARRGRMETTVQIRKTIKDRMNQRRRMVRAI